MRKRFYPWAIALPKKLSIDLATLFCVGNLKAPGTWGSAVGVIFYALIFSGIGSNSLWGIVQYVLVASFLSYIAIGVCDSAERALGMRDPGKIVLDEFVAIMFCFIPICAERYSLWSLLVGFGLFRFFDIKKPLGISGLQVLEGGVGCVADDIAAALATCACLNIIGIFIPAIYL
jgi:phosphatidylglycerophosphatase A